MQRCNVRLSMLFNAIEYTTLIKKKLNIHSNFSILFSHIKGMKEPYHSFMRQKLFKYSFRFDHNRSFDLINIFSVIIKVLIKNKQKWRSVQRNKRP